MNPVKRPPFRKIAENQLEKCFGDLDPVVKNELATSLVRQWLANDGHAGFVTSTHQFWFEMNANGDGYEAGFDKCEGNWGRKLSEVWHVDEKEIPEASPPAQPMPVRAVSHRRWPDHPAPDRAEGANRALQ